MKTAAFKAGFRNHPGQLTSCFVEMLSWDCAPEPVDEGKEANPFQQALREVWNLPDAKLHHLTTSKPVTSFMLSGDDGVVAMRAWFSNQFEKINTVAQQHEYLWKTTKEVSTAPNETLEALAEQNLSNEKEI